MTHPASPIPATRPPEPGAPVRRGRTLLAATAASTLALGALLGAGTAAIAAPLPAGTTFDDGMVYVGSNSAGGLGNGTTTGSDSPSTADFSGIALADETITEFVSNGFTQLALADDGTLFSWGAGSHGELGDGTTTTRPTAAAIDLTGTPLAGKTVTHLALGYNTAYALASDGTVAAWGANSSGEVGDGTADERARPTSVDLTALGGATATGLFAQNGGGLIQASDGAIYGWGLNTDGVLVPGDPEDVLTPTAVDLTGSPLAGKTIRTSQWSTIGGGVIANVMLTTDGEVLAWGEAQSGILGQDELVSALPKPAPVPAFAGIDVTDLKVDSTGHAVALTSAGDVYTWGNGFRGGLGNGNTDSSGTPTKLVLPAPAIQIATSIFSGFAVLSDGTVSAWGDPSFGTLGNGTSSTPQQPETMPSTGTALGGRQVTALRTTFDATIMFTKPAAITPISILTPADGSTVEPGFIVTGTGQYQSQVQITDEEGNPAGFFDIGNSDGSWTAPSASHIAEGPQTFTFTQLADGSTATLTVTVVAAPVITPVTITGPAAGSTVGLRPALTGAGTADAIVTITDGATTLGTATVGTDGTWTFTPTADLGLGAHTFTATQDVDASTASIAVTVAAVTPTPDPTTPPAPGSGTGKLSATGADAAPLLLIGGILAAAGITATVLGRRKRSRTA